jgi:excisionase family DNA binding protein
MLCLSARPHENVREGFLTLAFEVLGPRESASVTADRQHMAGCLEGNSAIPEYLTVEETARRDRVSAPTIYRRCADGSLRHIRLGDPGPIRIPVSQLERLYDQSVSADGLRQEQLRSGAALVERRETSASRQGGATAASSRPPIGLRVVN